MLNSFRLILQLIILLSAFTSGFCQGNFKGLEPLFIEPRGYQAIYTNTAPSIDGDIIDSVWNKAAWSQEFVDIEGDKKPAPALKTKIKMLWNDSSVFICASLRDPHVWATLEQHDTILYLDNDFEVFIDPDNDGLEYYELEVNPKNTVFDLFLPKPYRNKGNAIIAYDFPGLKTAVKINGSLNDPTDIDSGWTVEICIPFKALDLKKSFKPGNGNAQWRINFSRVEYDIKVENGKYIKQKNEQGHDLPEHNWVWAPQGVINMHFPERWGYVDFTQRASADYKFSISYAELQKKYLWMIYYRQEEFFQKQKHFSDSLESFGLGRKINLDGKANQISMEATANQFMAFISDGKSGWSLSQEGILQPVLPK